MLYISFAIPVMIYVFINFLLIKKTKTFKEMLGDKYLKWIYTTNVIFILIQYILKICYSDHRYLDGVYLMIIAFILILVTIIFIKRREGYKIKYLFVIGLQYFILYSIVYIDFALVVLMNLGPMSI